MSKTRKIVASLSAAAAIALGPLVATAPVSSTPVNGTILTMAWESGELFSVNPTDASTTSVGVSTLISSTGIAWNPVDQKLYGIDYDNSPASLYTVDPETAATTVIGSMAIDEPTGLDVQPGTGTLFVVYDAPQGGSILATVNAATAAVTDIGPTNNVAGAPVRLSGIGFSPTDSKLYGFGYDGDGNLYEIDPATGVLTLLFSEVFAGYGVAFDCDGQLLAASSSNDLAEIDLSTGTVTPIGEMDLGVEQFTENLTVICDVPEPTTTTTAAPTTTVTPTTTAAVAAVAATPKFTG